MAVDVPKPYRDTDDLTESDLDQCFEYIETVFNSRQVTGDYITVGSVPGECLEDQAVDTSQLADLSVTLGKLAAAVQATLVPTGSVLAFAGTAAPTGYLMCDGSAVSRSTYASLYAIIGTAHGTGNGTTTFNLPDYRGRFLRGVDGSAGIDPDKASRTAMASGGNTGNNVGSVQGEAYKSHTHIQDAHEHTFTKNGNAGSTNTGITVPGLNYNSNNDGSPVHVSSTTATNQSSGGNETRPVNASAYFIIKT